MENKIRSEVKGVELEFKIDKSDNLKTLFQKVVKAARFCILGNKFSINIPKDMGDEDMRKLCEIASNFPSKESFMKLLDDLLFYVLYRREVLLLRGPKNMKRIKELSGILEEFSDYRNKIINRAQKGNVYDGVDRLVVLLTHSCQLRCRYCRVRKFKADMTRDVLFRAIELLFTSRKDDLQLQFFGGEPLLKFNLIKGAVKYAENLSRKTKKNLQLILTTNGIALTEDKLKYFKEHNFLIEFSIDGDKKAQLKTKKSGNGKNYYSVVEENLDRLLKMDMPYYTITVVTPETVSELFRNFIYLVKRGHRNIQINYSLGFYWDSNAVNKLLVQLNKINSFIKRNKILGIRMINTQRTRREPVVLNAELTVDCDGTIYLETGICLEEDFLRMKNNFRVADVLNIRDINPYSTTRFNNFYQLVRVYAGQYPEFRKIIINNIELGNFLSRFFKKGGGKHGN